MRVIQASARYEPGIAASARYEPGIAQFNTWLYHIASNLCKNELRDRSRREPHWVDNTVAFDEGADAEDLLARAPAPASYEPDVILERKEQRQAIRKAIQSLPAQFGVPFVLRDIQGLKYDEIRVVLDTALGSVKSRINRARAMLAEKLKDFRLTS